MFSPHPERKKDKKKKKKRKYSEKLHICFFMNFPP